MLNKRNRDKRSPVSYGNKHQGRVEDRRGGAERLRSSGRADRDRSKSNKRSGVQRIQRNEPGQLRDGTKKFSWWKRTVFWKWPWYKWLFRKNR